ncbi:hypothetical protein L838_5010 [Mycobacterium avium MAV_120709_2344]|nr:hypothetical protein L838_5010 [Mycobacterium avium MAV_120709_2344]
MGTAQLDPQRQCVTVTKWNAGRGGARPSARAGFEDLGGETEVASSRVVYESGLIRMPGVS